MTFALWLALLFAPPQAVVNHTVELGWEWAQGTGDAATGFHIQKAIIFHRFQVADTLSPDVRTWTDTDVKNGETYVYAVSAFNAAGDSYFSNRKVVTIVGRLKP